MPDSDRDQNPEGGVRVADLDVEPGDTREYELAVAVSATLVGDRGPLRVHRRYRALPRQNDTVDHDAVDTNDELLDDPGVVHLHTTFWTTDGAGDGGEEDAVGGRGAYLGDDHAHWDPTDVWVLADGASFEDACRAHFRETASGTYERGVDAQ